ncbi:hypothetical protein [Aliiroseovarius lamellibrachiae]|uniref:hypothetical protein n=1 Tax=Aliiroseovarius lamellibrachiae TaxID=1924933 RepID=UPI001BDFEAC4|nr:hypothetical protein [Aliiroseovarius lamellibrachiae]
MRAGLCLLVICLSGCLAAPETSSNAAAKIGVTVHPDAQGLAISPVDQRIDFGRSPKGVLPALDRELGAHRALPLTHCPTSIAAQHQWGKLVLTFTGERFVGWRKDGQRQGMTCTS